MTADLSAPPRPSILVDADAGRAAWIVEAFRLEGHDVLVVPPGGAARAWGQGREVALVVLHGEPASVVQTLHELQRAVAVVVRTHGDLTPAENYLDAGAVDVVPSSVGRHELIARTRAILRRPARRVLADVLQLGPMCLDLGRHVFTYDGSRVHLPPKEFALLELLLRRRGRLVDRAEILDLVWGVGRTGDPKTIDVHVKRLRDKLEPVPSHPRHLLTIRGRGYRLEA